METWVSHVAQGSITVGYLILTYCFARAAVNTTSYTKRVVRNLTALVTLAWAAYYAFRTIVGHPPVWTSRVANGLLIGLFGYQVWLMRVHDRVASEQ